MKRKVLFMVTIVLVIGCLIFSMGTKVSANGNAEETKTTKELSDTPENGNSAVEKAKKASKHVTRKQEGFTFTYRLYVDYMDFYSFRKGHDGEYTISYTINDEESFTTTMKIEGFELFNNQPTYVSHYVDVEGVTEGDTIEYTYSYMNNYMQYDTPSVESGIQIVE